jgi:hypothetical protein
MQDTEIEVLREIVKRIPTDLRAGFEWADGNYEAFLKLAIRMREQGFVFDEIETLLTAAYIEVATEWGA